MIYLDTHVVVWLYEGDMRRISKKAATLIDENDLFISPIIRLELSLLHQIKRISVPARQIINHLENNIGLRTCDHPFDQVMTVAEDCLWTKDPFDRIIVSQAAVKDDVLLTKDRVIRKHYAQAAW